MTPKQKQFCYAIAYGHATRARELAPQINITQHNNWGYSPALMLLWALHRGPQVLAKKLDELFPRANGNPRTAAVLADPKEMEAMIRELVLPELKRSLNKLLKPIGLKVVSLDKVGDHKQNHFIESAFSAVDVIINDEFFDDINASQRSFAERLFAKLVPIIEKMQLETKSVDTHKKQAEKPTKEQPYTIQLLMAILNGKENSQQNLPALNLQVTLAPIGRTFLPSAGLPKPLPSLRCQPKPLREEEENTLRHRMAPGVH